MGGKSVTSNTKLTNYQTVKAQTGYQSPYPYFGKNDKLKGSGIKVTQPKKIEVKSSGAIKHLFAGDVATSTCDQCREGQPQ